VKRVNTVFAFDLDDTLVSEADYVESGLRAAGAILDAAAPGGESAAQWLVQTWRAQRANDVFQQLLQARGLPAVVWLPRLKEAYRGHVPNLALRRGAAEVLSALADGGARLALLSDGYLDVQRLKWASLKLPCRFDPVVFTDAKGREYWKPHPWGFEQVMLAHPDATRFFYVADNPAKDFISPNRLRWTTVMVRDGANLHSAEAVAADGVPTITLESLSGLLEFA
jgi:putative hydrolase of the HAD superfamily